MNDALDIVYLLLLAVFGSLTLYTLFTSMMQATQLKQLLLNVDQQLHEREERLEEIRQDMRQMDSENSLLAQEREALEAQESCMRQLEKSYRRADPEDGDTI